MKTNGEDPIQGNEAFNGLTKREYFAAMAMQGLLACNSLYNGKENKELLCLDARLHADALINELNK